MHYFLSKSQTIKTTFSFVFLMISFATDPKYFEVSYWKKSAPLFPRNITSTYLGPTINYMIQSRITSAVLLLGSLERISIVVYSKQSLSSSSYSTLSLIFFMEILSCSHIIIVIRSYFYLIRHKRSRPFIDLSEPSINAQKLKPSGF